MRQAHDKVIVDANGEILTKEKSGSFASKKQDLMNSRMSHQTKFVNTIASVVLSNYIYNMVFDRTHFSGVLKTAQTNLRLGVHNGDKCHVCPGSWGFMCHGWKG